MYHPHPSDEEILTALVPRLKELAGLGHRVFVDIDGYAHQVILDENDKPHADNRLLNSYRPVNQKLFDQLYNPFFPDAQESMLMAYTLDDALSWLWVEITVANYKGKITPLTTKS